MKYYFGVENLRSISSMRPVELRPITILVGRNSAGKSTFLRSLPLLRQSLTVRTSGPVLWYGDFVDFGEYKQSVRRGCADSGISFNFMIRDFTLTQDFSYLYFRLGETDIPPLIHTEESKKIKQVKLKFILKEVDELTVRKKVELNIKGANLEMFLSDDGRCDCIHLNGEKIEDLLRNQVFKFRDEDILSPLDIYSIATASQPRRVWHDISHLMFAYIKQIFDEVGNKKINNDTLIAETTKLLKYTKLTPRSILKLYNSTKSEEMKGVYKKLTEPNYEYTKTLNQICGLYTTLSVYEQFCTTFNNLIRNTTYIGPSRVTNERYHRIQNFEVSEIAPDGRNLPIFLASLKKKPRADFSDWIKSLFNFGVDIKTTEGHISIKVDEVNKKDTDVNLTDTGYGISQILPVLAKVWWATFSRNSRSENSRIGGYSQISGQRNSPSVVAIEQPELHLHPAYQSLLADTFVNAINSRPNHNLIFVIETHSETFIDRLGELIENGEFDTKNVEIVIFEKNEESKEKITNVSISEFDEEGVLDNWPYGFFRG